MFRRNRQNISLNYLGEKSEIQGDLHLEGNLRIDGIIHGIVEVMGDLEVSHSGLIEGQEVRANNIILNGVIKGRVEAEGKLYLGPNARLEADTVTAGSLIFEEGAYFDIGRVTSKATKVLPGSGKLPELMSRERESLP